MDKAYEYMKEALTEIAEIGNVPNFEAHRFLFVAINVAAKTLRVVEAQEEKD